MHLRPLCSLPVLVLLAACGGSETGAKEGASGGAGGSAGAVATGGATTGGTTTGGTGSGGTFTGGTPSAGGTTPSTGGTSAGGTVPSTGGTTSAGGTTPSTGGTSAGGTTPSTGGTSTGGTSTGGTSTGGTSTGGTSTGGTTSTGARVRIMAANTSSGTKQSYDPGHGIRIFQGLRPDIVLIQEFKYLSSTPADLRAFVDTAFGSEFNYYREPVDSNGDIPNGIISRYPILDSGFWDDTRTDNRELAWARLDVPGPTDLWAVSVHLLTANPETRQAEAAELLGYLQANVPADALVVVGGDFNTDTADEPAHSVVLPGYLAYTHQPDDGTGNIGTNTNRLTSPKPYDWVLPDPDLDRYHVPVRVGANTFPNGLVFDTRVYQPLSDVAPVQAEDSTAPVQVSGGTIVNMMQHMAVVKDYLLPR